MTKKSDRDMLRTALAELIEAVTKEVDDKDGRGGSGYLLARLSDARKVLRYVDSTAPEATQK